MNTKLQFQKISAGILRLTIMLTVFFSIITFKDSISQVFIAGAVSGNGTYPTMSDAFTALNSGSQTGAVIIMQVLGTITEPATGATLNSNTWSAISIICANGSMITGSINPGGSLIYFNGADNVTVSGPSGGAPAAFQNTSTSSAFGTSTIRFSRDASGNRIYNMVILGSSTTPEGTDGGTVYYDSLAISTGNDLNIISGCTIGPAGVNLPTKAICNSGSVKTATSVNNGNKIELCSIYDFFSSTNSSYGFIGRQGSYGNSILNNKFFQTAARTQTSFNLHSMIRIVTGDFHTITGNTIGYSSALAVGTYAFNGVSGSKFRPIYISSGTAFGNYIDQNTITAISIGGSMSGTGASSPFIAIHIENCLAQIGSSGGNIIGSMTDSAKIIYASGSLAASDIYGIAYFGSYGWTSNNNGIGGIRLSSNTAVVRLYCLYSSSSSSWMCSDNTIGGSIVSSLNNTCLYNGSVINGIINTASSSTINNNTIRNLTNAGGSGTGVSASVTGILNSSPSNNHTLSSNKIYQLTNTNTSFPSIVVTGIYHNGSTGSNIIEKNKIWFLNVSGNSASINGIDIISGNTEVRNNMISIGTYIAGTDVSKGAAIKGIIEAGTSNNFYFNSIYIGGNATEGTASTFCLYSTVTSSRNYLNNIFQNSRSNAGSTGKHYSVLLAGTTPDPAGLNSNFNVLYATGSGGVIGYYNSADRNTLSDWKSATGQDSSSYSADPDFVDPAGSASDADLHIKNPTIIEGLGTPLPAVTEDHDGEVRSSLTPVDIGADAGNFVNSYPVLVNGANSGNGVYTNLSSAFTALSFGIQTGANIIVTITDTVSEASGGATLLNGAWNSLKIMPGGGNNVLVWNTGTTLLNLTGAQRVTIDGLDSAGNSLTFLNTMISTFGTISTVAFTSDASNNKITRCSILGSSLSGGGNIVFGAAGSGNGNDNNTISFCKIGSNGSNYPATGVYFGGTTTSSLKNNSSNSIISCEIYNCFAANQNSAGVSIAPGSTQTSVFRNKFYLTSAVSLTSASRHSAVNIENTFGGNFSVSSNIIGFSSAAGTGSYTVNGTVSGNSVSLINIKTGNLTASSIDSNVISNVTLNGIFSGTGAASPFKAISADSGWVNITRNTIGSMTSSNNIFIAMVGTAIKSVYGISMFNTINAVTSNNNIGGVTLNTGGASSLYAIANYSQGIWTCQTNNIGGSVINSLSLISAGQVVAIANYSATANILYNHIQNLRTDAPGGTGSNASILGILSLANTSKQNITGNNIHLLRQVNPVSMAAQVYGMYFAGGNFSNLIQGNLIYNLLITGSQKSLYGINIAAGTVTVVNNMISLGAGTTGTSGNGINGITDNGGSNKIYYNSVYIFGNPSSGDSSTYSFRSNVLTDPRDYRNNIFYNMRSNTGSANGKHYSISLSGSSPVPAGLTSDHNDLYSGGTGGFTGYFNGSDLSSLSLFKAATGTDSSSISVNPQFINDSNLHINNSVFSGVNNAGIRIAGIISDFDGNFRDTIDPDIGADEFNGISGTVGLNMKIFIEGFYNAVSDLQRADTIKVFLRNSLTPYDVIDSATGVASDSGRISVNFNNVSSGNYYINTKHRNAVETWSMNAISLTQGSTTSYDFTTSASQAYGNNQKQTDMSPVSFSIYSGDVNQSGSIDLNDIIEVYNAAAGFSTGYLATDVTGDDIINLNDLTITYNNSGAFVAVKKPL